MVILNSFTNQLVLIVVHLFIFQKAHIQSNSDDENCLPENLVKLCPTHEADSAINCGDYPIVVNQFNDVNTKLDAQFGNNFEAFPEEPLFGQAMSKSYMQKTLLSIQFVAKHMENLDNYHNVIKHHLDCLVSITDFL